MDRKDFITKSCQGCLFGTAAILFPQLTGCGTTSNIYKTVVSNNQVMVPLQLFEKSNFQMVRPKGLNYDIAVQKLKEGDYTAILMRCTHMDNALSFSQNAFNCSLHGSRFTKDGKVIKGPAEIPLKNYNTTINDNQLIITI